MAKDFDFDFDVENATTGESVVQKICDEQRDKVVYQHKRADDGIPFYVGIGSVERPYVVNGRNDFWQNVYAKHGRIVEILYEGLTFEEACEIEIKLIAEYRSKYPDTMTNIGNGGETGPGLSGEDHGSFKGHILMLSLCGRYFFICSGTNDLESAGFHSGQVSETITGSTNYEYVSSKKIHINGLRIKFKPIRFNNEDEISDDMICNRIEAEVSNDEIGGKAGENCYLFGRTGESHPKFKGFSLGVNASQYVILSGGKDMKEKKFDDGAISKCISGKRQRHKGFVWSRIDENFDLESLKTIQNLRRNPWLYWYAK